MKFSTIIILLAVAALASVVGLVAWQASEGHRDQVAAANTDAAGKGQAAAQAEGHVAVQAVETQGQAEQATAALTEKNTDAILHAQGADVKVDPAAHDAGLHALCLRVVYRNNPSCRGVQQPRP